MGTFEVVTVVQRSIEKVFSYISDIRNTPNWYSAVVSAQLVKGHELGLDTQYRIVRNLPQGRAEDIVQVIEYDPPHRFRFKSIGGTTPFDYTYILTGTSETTKIMLHAEITLSGLPNLLSPIVTQAFKKGMQNNLKTLVAILEK